MSSFFDYYSGRPTPPTPPAAPTLPSPTQPVLPPIDPRYVLRRQYREEDPSEPDYAMDLIGGSNPALNIAGLQIINPEDVIHGDFSTYLAGMGLERNGTFGGVSPSDPDADVGRSIPLIDAHTLTDPTGKGFRGISKSGRLNVFAAASINEEFEALNEIAKFNAANADVVGNAKGFAIRLGDERGSVLYRLPGSSRYQGDLSVNGKTIPQSVARNIENYTQGASKGQELLAALTTGTDDDINKAVTDIDFTNALIRTDRGGYTLDGKFNAVVGVGRLGNLSDLKDLAQNQFRVVNNGKYNEVASNAIATEWLNGARNMGPDATQAELIAHLQNSINKATKQSDVMKSNTKPGSKTTTSTTETITSTGDDGDGAPPPTGGDGGPTGDDRISSLLAGGETRFVNVPGRGFVAIDEGTSFRERDDSENQGGRSYSLTREEVSTPSSSGDPRGYSMRALGGDVPSTDRPGFVEDEDRLVPESSTLTVNELQGNVEESGFIDRPPSEVTDAESVADNIPIPEAEEDGYVINVEAVKRAGEMDLIREIEEAENYVKRKGIELDKPKRPVLASSGEIYVRPEVVAAMGLDKLEKINKRGVPETKKKLKRTRRA